VDAVSYTASVSRTQPAARAPLAIDRPQPTLQRPRSKAKEAGRKKRKAVFGAFLIATVVVLAGLLVYRNSRPTPVEDTTIFFDDFESGQGWITNRTHSDTATTGQWERGDPEQTEFSGVKQLGTPVSGVYDLVTGGAAGSAPTSNSVSGGTTTIDSPEVKLPSQGELVLTFMYYFAHSVEASSADFFRCDITSWPSTPAESVDRVVRSATEVFLVPGEAANRDGIWMASGSISLTEFAGRAVRIRFEVTAKSPTAAIEAGVDDVRITQSVSNR
jgi:hypothetical protein